MIATNLTVIPQRLKGVRLTLYPRKRDVRRLACWRLGNLETIYD